ncbi:MAG: tRNA (adenosine(37)-N6)-threonylcarbamoyltransferase complex ATPase subunit type 1 TsaE [Syntrophaceae bacterium]|nr:tRNA (adenosine(37)-N6)-threonylcarbamoyltransferase complex ATPase subunit type 1 TsaE [Syntrophaceae bacterium]
MKILLKSRSPSDTIRIGNRIGNLLLLGDIVALVGELGAGKTQLIKGLAAGAGVRKTTYVSSPSFTLINEYAGRVPFYHIDLFRLGSEKEAEELGLEEYLQGRGVTAIEWADKIPSLLPKELLWIEIRNTGRKTRSLEITGKGERYLNLVDQIQSSEFGVGSSETRRRGSRLPTIC